MRKYIRLKVSTFHSSKLLRKGNGRQNLIPVLGSTNKVERFSLHSIIMRDK